MTKNKHHLLLSWLILTGLIIFGLFVSWNEGVLPLLFAGDKSNISLVITLIYFLVSIHCARRVWILSIQVNATNEIADIIRDEPELNFHIVNNKVDINGKQNLPPGIASEYIHDLITRANNHAVHSEEGINKESELIEVYESRLKGPHEIGWFAADSMIKLGLLGTIIGFILMLSSVANITDFDITTMQKILTNMSSGMGTALFTTMAGLVCSLLATIQYLMLERNIDVLIETVKHLAQVHIIPKLYKA